jgi:hypothetical protein
VDDVSGISEPVAEKSRLRSHALSASIRFTAKFGTAGRQLDAPNFIIRWHMRRCRRRIRSKAVLDFVQNRAPAWGDVQERGGHACRDAVCNAAPPSAGISNRKKVASIIATVNARGMTEKIEAKAFILACSAVETARHLLLNRTLEFPNGLANSSGQMGRNLLSHFGFYVYGFFPQLARRAAGNEDGTDQFHSLLTGLYWDQPHPNFDGSYQV